MTDRELLELAAKVYWAGEIDDVVSIEWSGEDNAILYTHAENQDHNGQDCAYAWNPLTDDGDALRLAVRLRITPHIDGNLTDAESMRGFCTEAHFDDPYAATRRAVVRAAAEMGKQKG